MKKKFFSINIQAKILIAILILFSLLINQYYGNRGIFPVDSFSVSTYISGTFDYRYPVVFSDEKLYFFHLHS